MWIHQGTTPIFPHLFAVGDFLLTNSEQIDIFGAGFIREEDFGLLFGLVARGGYASPPS